MKLQFTKQAREEFLRIVSVFAEYAGPQSANKFIKRVNDRGETLLKHPQIGHPEMLLADRQYESRGQALDSGTQNDRFLLCILTHSIRNDVF